MEHPSLPSEATKTLKEKTKERNDDEGSIEKKNLLSLLPIPLIVEYLIGKDSTLKLRRTCKLYYNTLLENSTHELVHRIGWKHALHLTDISFHDDMTKWFKTFSFLTSDPHCCPNHFTPASALQIEKKYPNFSPVLARKWETEVVGRHPFHLVIDTSPPTDADLRAFMRSNLHTPKKEGGGKGKKRKKSEQESSCSTKNICDAALAVFFDQLLTLGTLQTKGSLFLKSLTFTGFIEKATLSLEGNRIIEPRLQDFDRFLHSMLIHGADTIESLSIQPHFTVFQLRGNPGTDSVGYTYHTGTMPYTFSRNSNISLYLSGGFIAGYTSRKIEDWPYLQRLRTFKIDTENAPNGVLPYDDKVFCNLMRVILATSPLQHITIRSLILFSNWDDIFSFHRGTLVSIDLCVSERVFSFYILDIFLTKTKKITLHFDVPESASDLFSTLEDMETFLGEKEAADVTVHLSFPLPLPCNQDTDTLPARMPSPNDVVQRFQNAPFKLLVTHAN